MLIPRFIVSYIAKKVIKTNAKIVARQVIDQKYQPILDVAYLNDDNYYHRFDVYHAPDKRNNICVIDIHGGGYMFGDKKENYRFGTIFLEAGFDFIAVDYQTNRDGKVNVKNMFDDVITCFNYIFTHKKELGIENDRFVITGDSAGGHFALTMTELMIDEKYATSVGYKLAKEIIICCLVNCTTFDYVNLGEGMMNKAAKKRMLGPDALNIKARETLCPKVHIDSLTCPTFASTCKNDFIRSESIKLKEVMEKKNNVFEFIDLDVDKKEVGHVHNLLNFDIEETKFINNKMIEFILKNA